MSWGMDREFLADLYLFEMQFQGFVRGFKQFLEIVIRNLG